MSYTSGRRVTTGRTGRPDRLIFDLDPSDDNFSPVITAARRLGEALARDGLTPFVMTTGSSGLHVVTPLTPTTHFDTVRDYAQRLTARLADERPNELTTEQRKNKRNGRVYLDVARNAYAQTAVAPYSVRAKSDAPVATPLSWHELNRPDIHPRRFRVDNIFRRLAQRDSPWAVIDECRQPLPT